MTESSWQHAAEARAALQAIVSDPVHGASALSSTQTVSNLLKDLLPDAPRETGLLVAAAGAGVADSLREHVTQGMDSSTAIRLTASSLAANSAFTPDACHWVVGEIAVALGISDPAQIPAVRPGAVTTTDQAPAQSPAYPRSPAFPQSPPFQQGPGSYQQSPPFQQGPGAYQPPPAGPQNPSYQQPQAYPQGPSYQQYPVTPGGSMTPGGSAMGGGMASPRPPATLRAAVTMMWAGMALCLMSAIAVVLGAGQIRSLIERDNPGWSTTVVTSTVGAYMVIFVLIGVIGAGLWAWMAAMNRRGRSWARVLATVFFAIGTLTFLISALAVPVPVFRALQVVAWLDAMGATVLMWLRGSGLFYRAAKKPPAIQPYR